MDQPITEMQFGREGDRRVLTVCAYADGGTLAILRDSRQALKSPLTLQQTIQLRDFLNRHIDSLALGSIGASTERSSDDPTQLPAEHVIDGKVADFIAGNRSERG